MVKTLKYRIKHIQDFSCHLTFYQRLLLLCIFVMFGILCTFYLYSELVHHNYCSTTRPVKFLPLAHQPVNPSDYIDIFTYCPYFKQYNFSICIHNPNIDQWISGTLIQGKMWEQGTVDHFRRWLIRNSRYGFIDIGANIGVYSLMAGALGRKVIAVEPMPANLKLLRQSVARNRFQNNITIVPFAASDKYENVTLQTQSNNQGLTVLTRSKCKSELGYICSQTETFLLDDFLSLDNFTSNFKTSIMKIDIEGHEFNSLFKVKDLWHKIDIQVIMMEWQWVISNPGRKGWGELKVKRFLGMMRKLGYIPKGPAFGESLDPNKWQFWPNDVIWTKKEFIF